VTDPDTKVLINGGKMELIVPSTLSELIKINHSTGLGASYFFNTSGAANYFDASLFLVAPGDEGWFSHYRNSNFTGSKGLRLFNGDGTSDIGAQFGLNGLNSYILGGNFGIGTDAPIARLHVEGDGYFRKDGQNLLLSGINSNYLRLESDNGQVGIFGFTKPGNTNLEIINKTPGGDMVFRSEGAYGFGIAPQVALHASGNRLRLSTPGDPGRFVELRTDGAALDLNSNNGPLYIHSNTDNVYLGAFGNSVIVGNQGIAPTDRFEVIGNMKVHGFDAVVHGRSEDGREADLVGTYQGWDADGLYLAGYNAINAPGTRSTRRIYMGGAGTETLVADLTNQRVGIGVTLAEIPAGYTLAVDGRVICEELRVRNSASWPDYVFEANYELPSLKAVQQHIQEKGHLPGIPSAAEVSAQGGVEVGEMQRLLLEKVEQLTLYAIETEKQNTDLRTRLDNANANMLELIQRIEKLEGSKK
ncbi:MAG: hypothetical protein HUU01_22070, partial [Saprospiraceae bacterium]|nr:hypothetical protein [Saprospiraceae bacterium]